MQVRVLRVSSVVSSTSIHFLTAGEDGEADHNRKTEPSSTLSPRSRICDKESEDTNKMSGGAEAGIIDGATDTGLLFYSV